MRSLVSSASALNRDSSWCSCLTICVLTNISCSHRHVSLPDLNSGEVLNLQTEVLRQFGWEATVRACLTDTIASVAWAAPGATPAACTSPSKVADQMALVDFIREHDRKIIDQFEVFARTLAPVTLTMTSAELRDHAQEMLAAAVIDLGEPQTSDEQFRKSIGLGLKGVMKESGRLHADDRIAHQFNANQVIAEFRALRASVLRQYADHGGEADLVGVERFNEAIDEALAASVDRFAEQLDVVKDQFIGMLSHDLRSPLSAITAGASLLTQTGDLEPQRVRVASRILTSAQRMTRMISDLLDLTRTRLGAGIPIIRKPTDLEPICQEVALEMQAFHPDAQVHCRAEGDLRGEWDPDRLTQVVSNLVGNALQHGDGGRVEVVGRGVAEEVVLTVHNEGPPIPSSVQRGIFEPLARFAPTEGGSTTSIGLGLFIARAIVVAHSGTITASSAEGRGTTFEVRLPRRGTTGPTS